METVEEQVAVYPDGLEDEFAGLLLHSVQIPQIVYSLNRLYVQSLRFFWVFRSSRRPQSHLVPQ